MRKKNNVLFIGIDKTALATALGVTPSYVRQILRGARSSPKQLEKIEIIFDGELRKLRRGAEGGKELLEKLIMAGQRQTAIPRSD